MGDERGLHGHKRRTVLANLRAQRLPCWICGLPIAYDGVDNQRHPLAMVGDEVIPRSHDGDPKDWRNVAPSHRRCNGKRSNRPVTPQLRADCRREVLALTGQATRATTTRDW